MSITLYMTLPTKLFCIWLFGVLSGRPGNRATRSNTVRVRVSMGPVLFGMGHFGGLLSNYLEINSNLKPLEFWLIGSDQISQFQFSDQFDLLLLR